MKLRVLFILTIFTSLVSLGANDLTKIGVVDINEVYTRFIKESADARKFDVFKRSIEEEISKRKIEIDQIDKKLIEARDDDNEDLVAELESDLQIRKINLQEYSRYKNKELNARISSDATKEDFSRSLQDAIREVGLQNGYSIIMQSKDPNIIWYHKDIDVTELVIQNLMR